MSDTGQKTDAMSAGRLMARDPIMPKEGGAAPLDFVIAVMALLAALALGASLIASRAAEGWQKGLSDRITVQVLPAETGDVASGLTAETRAALAVLNATPGIVHARELSDAEIEKLVEPWIGNSGVVAGIPLPRLIDASLAPGEGIDTGVLAAKLKTAAPHAVLDDHRRWIARLQGLADTVRYAAYGILLLIAGATAAVVTLATRAGLDAHHEMVALLHQMGARAGFIARSIEWHYFISALAAATAGTVLAVLLFQGLAGLEFVGVEAVPFLPPLSLALTELPWLALVPVTISVIAWATARISVLSVVRAIY
jgi:cell division transport system permease protein